MVTIDQTADLEALIVTIGWTTKSDSRHLAVMIIDVTKT
jgi:hypothetical protein